MGATARLLRGPALLPLAFLLLHQATAGTLPPLLADARALAQLSQLLSTRDAAAVRADRANSEHSVAAAPQAATPSRRFTVDAASTNPTSTVSNHPRQLLQTPDSSTATPADGPVGLSYCSDNSLPNGPHPYPDSCTRFVLCTNGLTYTFTCAACVDGPGAASAGGCVRQASLVFNPQLKLCDWPLNVPTCLPEVPLLAAPTPATVAPAPTTTPSATPSLPASTPAATPAPAQDPVAAPAPVSTPSVDGEFRSATSPDAAPGAPPPPPPPTLEELLERFPTDFRGSDPYGPVPARDSSKGVSGSKPYWASPAYGGDGDDGPSFNPDDLFEPEEVIEKEDSQGGKGGKGGSSSSGGSTKGDPCGAGSAAGVLEAEHSPVFEVPVCGLGGASCEAKGLRGKGRSEQDGPNTLYGECADGAPGGTAGRGYVAGVALKSFVPGAPLRSSQLAYISADVVCDPAVPRTYLDFYVSGDVEQRANRPWTPVATIPCTSLPSRTRPSSKRYDSPAFLLPPSASASAAAVVVRVQLREANGRPLSLLPFPCSPGSYGTNDRDDLVVEICPRKSLLDGLRDGLGGGLGGGRGVGGLAAGQGSAAEVAQAADSQFGLRRIFSAARA